MDENYCEYQDSQKKSRFRFTLERDLLLLQTVLRLNPYLSDWSSRWQEVLDVFKTRGYDMTIRGLQSRVKVLREQYKQNHILKTGTEEEQRTRIELLHNLEEMIESATSVNDGFNNESEESVIMTVSHDEDDDDSRAKEETIDIELHTEDHEYTVNTEHYRPHKRSMYSNDDDDDETATKKACIDATAEERLSSEEDKERRFYEERKRKDDIIMKQLQIQSQLMEQNKALIGIVEKVIKLKSEDKTNTKCESQVQ